ncbi:short-chain dehydrogenase protein [Rutstroemia sp. NJR-2017a WRK4]|nr:short-chain dehydrogenase protein [Rutstroemia sp. NJR-2017a WRK4]
MLGKLLLTLSAAGQAFGSFLADFNETHVYNPRWPPHAKFHNGQTMSMGIGLGLATLYYTYRRTASKAAADDSLFTAAIVGSLYWITGVSAILYPGTKMMDPEFGDGSPQAIMFPAFAALAWAGWWLETKVLA